MAAAVEQQFSNMSITQTKTTSSDPPKEPPASSPSKEDESSDDSYIRSDLLPDDDFNCWLGKSCLEKDPKLKIGKQY